VSLEEAFKFIGITFVFFITLCCGGEMYESIKKHKPLESAAMLRAAGIAALGTLMVIGAGLATWLIGLVFRSLFWLLANR
jgi:hypothetical protein